MIDIKISEAIDIYQDCMDNGALAGQGYFNEATDLLSEVVEIHKAEIETLKAEIVTLKEMSKCDREIIKLLKGL